jgi:hypothetical protein
MTETNCFLAVTNIRMININYKFYNEMPLSKASVMKYLFGSFNYD